MLLSNYKAELRRLLAHTKLMPVWYKAGLRSWPALTDKRGHETSRLAPSGSRTPLHNQRGFGLVAALFAVIILAMFGVLAARYIFTTSISSAEDYLWTQALYGAEATAHRRILYRDCGGGGGCAGVFTEPLIIQNTTCSTVPAESIWNGSGFPAAITVRSTAGTDITRTIRINFIL